MYESKFGKNRNVPTTQDVGCVRLSKNSFYEQPYTVIGSIKHTGLKELPKSICMDKSYWNVVSIKHGELNIYEVLIRKE